MHRGARKAQIFKLPDDCYAFFDVLQESVERCGIEIHAYSLMPNHYHLLVNSPLGTLSKAMQFLNGTYTLYLNRRYRWDGPVFRGRFHSQLITNEEHLRILLAYFHLNPIRAHLTSRLSDESWTSHRIYIGKKEAPSWLTTATFCHLLDGPEGVHRFVQSVRQGAIEYPEDFNPDTGLFGKKVLALSSKTARAGLKNTWPADVHPRQRPVEAVLADVMRMANCSLEDLRRPETGPRANPPRRFAAWALNRASRLSQKEIAVLLEVPYHQVTRLLGRIRKGQTKGPVQSWIKEWLANELLP